MKQKIDYLVLRWTLEQRQKAYNIESDIENGIDNKESRVELRRTIAIYADMLSDALFEINMMKVKALLDDMDRLVDSFPRDKD